MHLTRPVLFVSSLSVLWASPALARTVVDCSKPQFQLKNTPRSLYLWSNGAEERISQAKKQGTFGVDPKAPPGASVYRDYCPKMIGYRGTAHCKEPGNAEYRAGLVRLLALCKPNKPAPRGGPVDCSDKRFANREASVDLALRWTDSALRGLDGLQPHEGFRIKAKCDQALQYAGTAYCKAPGDPRTTAAIAKVNRKCAAVKAAKAASEAQAVQDEKDRKVAAKANRKIVRFPRSTYRGAGAAAVAREMKRALLASRLAKSAREVLKVQPMGSWKRGRYSDTKLPYKKITGLVLWWDKDKDGVCRFVSYNFIKDRGPLKAKSFCMGCPEGWVKCK